MTCSIGMHSQIHLRYPSESSHAHSVCLQQADGEQQHPSIPPTLHLLTILQQLTRNVKLGKLQAT